jgi:murein DD-endopeptidase MepM/ murein hydrolase activator NlpD
LDSEIEKKRSEIQSLMQLMQLTDADNGYLEYIFGAKDMTDFVHRVTMIEELANYNDQKIEELNKMIEQSKSLQLELKRKQITLTEQINLLNGKIQKYNSELNSLSDLIVDVAGEIKTLRDSIAYYRSKGCKDNQDLDVCLRNNLPYDTAFWRPILYGAVTSEYGWRIHPTYNTYKMHYGIDLNSRNLATGGAENTNILASASGKVAVINNKNNNSCGGNYIIIHHNIKGVEYSTLYMHLKKINVKLGDIVSKDTVVALMGGNPYAEPGYTPWDKCSTGKHLHFAMSRGLNLTISNTDKNSFNPRTLVNFTAGTYKNFTNRTTKY